MATSPKRSLASRAGAAARKVVRRSAAGAKAGDGASAPATNGTSAATAKKASTRKTPAKKAPAKKAPAKQSAPAKQTAAKKSAPTKQTAAKKSAPTKAPTKQAVTKKAAAPAKKAPATKAPATKAPAKTPAKKATATKTPTKTPAKKATVTKTPAKSPRAAAASSLVVLAQEEPWTRAELAEVRDQLRADVQRLAAELAVAEEGLVGLLREGADGAGNDQADVGTATFERDQEMTIANNARDMLAQSEHALARIADGSYGVCESCGNPIGKNRLMAFPRATMCLSCKQRQERR